LRRGEEAEKAVAADAAAAAERAARAKRTKTIIVASACDAPRLERLIASGGSLARKALFTLVLG
jgi:hypothetical protein